MITRIDVLSKNIHAMQRTLPCIEEPLQGGLHNVSK